eukprot:4924447-Prymnesium_polylepis.1
MELSRFVRLWGPWSSPTFNSAPNRQLRAVGDGAAGSVRWGRLRMMGTAGDDGDGWGRLGT